MTRSDTFTIRLLVGLLLIAVPVTSVWATTRQEAETAIADAAALHEEAVAAGAGDSQAAQMIQEATALLSTKQYTKARMIAYWAVRQTEFAMKIHSGDAVVEGDKAARAEAMIAAAEAARQKADSVGGEWRDTASMIKSARTYAGAGEFDKAIEAASAAKFQSERGYEQAMAEKDAGFPAYMIKASQQ